MVKLRIKPSLFVMKESEDLYQVIFTSTRKIKKFEVDSLVRACISELRHEASLDDIIGNLRKEYDVKDIVSCIDSLKQEGLVVEWDQSRIDTRYERQVAFISELTTSLDEALELQEKLRTSKVAVFGTGGIGTWVVNGLYQLGIGEIRVSDPDVVSLSNLNRQLFFTSYDVGKKKVDVLKEKLPDGNILKFEKTINDEEDLSDMVKGTDFIINCADSPSIVYTSRMIDKFARKYSAPYMVAGGYNMHLGMVGAIINPGKSACFECLMKYQKTRDQFRGMEVVKDIEQSGNLGPIAGAIANLHVMEVFKFLTGKGEYNENKFYEIDFLNFSVEWRKFEKMPDCTTCNPL